MKYIRTKDGRIVEESKLEPGLKQTFITITRKNDNIIKALESLKANIDKMWKEAQDRGDTATVDEMSDYSESVLMTIEWFLGNTACLHSEEGE